MNKKKRDRENRRRYREKNPEKVRKTYRAWQLKTFYGITSEERDLIIRAQNNRCAICGKLLIKTKDTQIDHNHKTNKVRGILCANCNLGLGQFQDNILILQRAISYLERHEINGKEK